MKIALVDNGSLEPAAHESLRRAADEIARATGMAVDAVSWKHSDRIAAASLAEGPAWTLAPWVRAQVAAGEREFVLIPFFISPQGAIGSSLRAELDSLRSTTGGFACSFTEGLAEGSLLAEIVAARIREAAADLGRPAVIVVDHGGPSPASAAVRDRVAKGARAILGSSVGALTAASMESPAGDGFAFNRPLLAEALRMPGFNSGDVLIAPLFLSPGRHAGPRGDLVRIAGEAQDASPGLRCHFTQLIGSHPAATAFLADALSRALKVGAHT